jgi:EmrB/QacA subfamily drug resistance transporter
VSVKTDTGSEAWILAASILGSSMAFIDGTVVNVALPVIQQDLGATGAEVQWILEAYLLTLSALLLLGGSLADRLGRRRIFSSGTALFAAASIGCALAPSTSWLIVSRAVQGVGGALLVPTSLALLGAGIPDERRGQAIGKWSAFSAATAAFGPVLGGWLVQAGSWRWVFWINVPIALATLIITSFRLPESRDPRHTGLDLPGAMSVTLGLGGIVFALLEGPRFGLGHPLIVAACLAATIAVPMFLRAERRSRSPMIPLDIFRSRTFSGANALTFLLYAALGATLFFLPFNLIQVHHYTPAQSGAALLPMIGLVSLLSGWSGRLADRYGPRPSLIAGPLIAALAYTLFALPGTEGSYWSTFLAPVTVLGLGMAVTVAPLTTTVMRSAGAARAGIASGINNAVSRTASLLAIAAYGILAYQRFRTSLEPRLDSLGLSAESLRQLRQEERKLAAATIPPTLSPALQHGVSSAIAGAFVQAFRVLSLVSAALVIAAALVAWLFLRGGEERR